MWVWWAKRLNFQAENSEGSTGVRKGLGCHSEAILHVLVIFKKLTEALTLRGEVRRLHGME
jgi:hypothetical protein